jgi:biopolymer transport protein ExbB/TolQ
VTNLESLVEAVSAATGTAVVVGGVTRRFWVRRETRQQVAFRRAVQDIVDESVADVLRRQAEAERRQGQHLDRQDKAIERLRRLVETRLG